MSVMPTKRSDLLVERGGDEVLVYDRTTDAVHRLSPEATSVWELCDGTTTTVAAASAVGLSREAVHEALAQLDGAGLLGSRGLDRRSVLKRSALVGGTVMVTTLVAPRMAAAVSGSPADPIGPGPSGTFFVPAGATLKITNFSAGNGAGHALSFGYRINQAARTQLGTSAGNGGTYPQPDFTLPTSANARLFEVYLFDNLEKPAGASDEDYYFYTSNPNHALVSGNDFYIRDNGGGGSNNRDANQAIAVDAGINNLRGTITIT